MDCLEKVIYVNYNGSKNIIVADCELPDKGIKLNMSHTDYVIDYFCLNHNECFSVKSARSGLTN